MSKAGQKLTPSRRRILERFDAQLAATGCTREDVYRLEAALNVKLVAVDALGNTLWDSGKYGKRTKIIVPCHNNHAWSEIPIDPPKISEVRGFDFEAENELSALSSELRNRKTTAAQKTMEQKTREIILSFVDRQWRLPEQYINRIHAETRLWLCGETLMGSDGTLWRSVSTSRALDCAFEDETQLSPQDICVDPEWTFDCIGLRAEDRAVVLTYLQAQVDRGERVLPSEVFPFIENEESRQALSELICMMWLNAEYHKATHSMGGATSYRFQKWLARENIKPTPDKYRATWQMAQVEAKVWNSSDPAAAASDHHHLDMRAAYLACEDSIWGGVGDAIDLVRRYGFPTNMMLRASVEGVPLGDVLTLTGAIQLTRWRFSPETHPFTVGRIGEHLRENQGWITTPELTDLVDSGDIIEAEAREVIYSVGIKPGINFPSDRDLAVRFVGKCARHGFESSIIVRDRNEAAYLTNYLGGTDRLLNFEHAGDVHLIEYKDTKVRAQWFHIRVYVLAYTNIGLRRMLRRFPQDGVLRICTDALYVKKLPEEVANMLVEERPRYGQWRHKTPGYEWRPEAAEWKIEYVGQLDLAPTPTPRLPSDIKAAATRCMYLAGRGGGGKTHWAVETFRGRRLVVLVPENDLAEKHRKDEQLGLAAEQVQTLHHYFCLPIGRPIESWDPIALGRRLDGIAKVIIIDEALKIPSKILKVVLDHLGRRSCQVICAGNLGQLPPWGDKTSPHEMLLEWASPNVRWFDTDYRALCEACGDPFSCCQCTQGPKSSLHDVKARMWRTSDQNQLDVFSESFTSTPFAEAIANTTPNDIWLCSTNKLGAQVEGHLLRHHRANFPGFPAKIRFDPDDDVSRRYRKQGQPILIPGRERHGETVPGYRGSIVSVPLEVVERGLPPEWKYTGWMTVHRIQGGTIQPPGRLFIVEHGLSGWISNVVYTAVSRVRLLNQIIRVCPPDDMQGEIIPTEIQSTPSRELIDAKLKRYALEDRRKNLPRCKNRRQRLTTDHVLELINTTDKKCSLWNSALVAGLHEMSWTGIQHRSLERSSRPLSL